MITIKSFYPFRGLLSITQHFHDEKVIVKIKSLTYENEFDFKYTDIAEISTSYSPNHPQTSTGFWIVLACSFFFGIFSRQINTNPTSLLIAQFIYITGVFLFITGYRKSLYIHFSNQNDQPLTFLKQTTQNQKLIQEAMNKVRNSAKDSYEVDVEHPFPNEKYFFEHFEFDVSNLKNTTDRFFDDKIIGLQKSLFGKSAYMIKYDQLNGKIYHGKIGINIADSLFSIIVFIASVLTGAMYAFDINIAIATFLFFIYILLTIFVISLLLKLIKQETIGLYDKKGNIIYWTYINRKNKASIEKALTFVQSKIPSDEKG